MRVRGKYLLQEVALPDLTGPYALVRAGLVVLSPLHGPAVDRVDDAVLGKEPELIAPLLRVAFSVLCVVVVNQVSIEDVILESRMKFCVAPVVGERHLGGSESCRVRSGIGRLVTGMTAGGSAFEHRARRPQWLYIEELSGSRIIIFSVLDSTNPFR